MSEIRILLFDAGKSRIIIERYLQREKYAFAVTEDPQIAKKLLESGIFDLMVTDIQLLISLNICNLYCSEDKIETILEWYEAAAVLIKKTPTEKITVMVLKDERFFQNLPRGTSSANLAMGASD